MKKIDKLLILILIIILLGLAINYLGYLLFKIFVIGLILIICVHMKIKSYFHMISVRNRTIAEKIDTILTKVYSFFRFIKPIKLGDNFFMDISQILIIAILCFFLII